MLELPATGGRLADDTLGDRHGQQACALANVVVAGGGGRVAVAHFAVVDEIDGVVGMRGRGCGRSRHRRQLRLLRGRRTQQLRLVEEAARAAQHRRDRRRRSARQLRLGLGLTVMMMVVMVVPVRRPVVVPVVVMVMRLRFVRERALIESHSDRIWETTKQNNSSILEESDGGCLRVDRRSWNDELERMLLAPASAHHVELTHANVGFIEHHFRDRIRGARCHRRRSRFRGRVYRRLVSQFC